MKSLIKFLGTCYLLFVFTHHYKAQCETGTLPATLLFETCCVGSVTNLVTYTVYNDAEEIVDQGVLDISGAPTNHNFDLCLPEGCYYTTLSYSAGFNTSQHLASFEVIGENTSSFNVFQTSNNIPFSFGFCVTGAPITCQAAFEITVEEDGVINVINTSSPTEGYTNIFAWDYGDETNMQGFEPSHTYSVNGIYEVCLFQALYDGDIPVCVSDFCQTIEMNTVPDNSGCPTSINLTADEQCGIYSLAHNGNEIGTNYWFVDDAFYNSNNILELNFMEAGDHQICIAHVSATCESSTTICTTINNPDCSNSLCPTEITAEQTGCHTYTFHLNNLGNFGNIVWNFGDGETSGGQNHVTHTFDSLGIYTICATAFGTYCQDGVELCYTLDIAPCGGPIEPCSGTLYQSIESDCGHVHFEAGNLPEGSSISWIFGDGVIYDGLEHVLDHHFEQPGIYTVVAMVFNQDCPNNLTLYTVVTIEDCFPPVICPENMYAGATPNCTTWHFEIGSATAGESVVWNFGDGHTETGGHFASHTYTENGTYQVCGTFTSANCPDGIEFCTTIQVDCGIDCSIEIEQIPTSCGLAIFQANININVAEIHWSFDGNNAGLTGYTVTIDATDGTYPICAWYDSEACFAPIETCTEVVIDNCNTCTELTFGFDSFINNGGTTYLNWSIYNANDLAQIETGVAQYSVNDPYYDSMVCLEDGCYIITAFNNAPFNLEAVDVNFGESAEIISIDHINSSGSYGYEILISVNGNCSVDCDIAGFSYVSYPSYGGMPLVYWQLINSSNQIVDSGSNDFTPMEVNQSYYACLEEDCYTLVFSGSQPFDGNANFTHYLSGSWTLVSTEYGDDGTNHTMTLSLNVNSNCNPILCELELTAMQLEPGIFEFTAYGNPEVYPMFWDFGDGQNLEATWVTIHEYPLPGEYTICAHIQTDACGIVEACTTIVVEGESPCDFSIWSGPGNVCGDFIFEISGGSVLGPIVWDFGNEVVTDNQSLVHHFDMPGTYTVSASGSSNLCPNFYYTTSVVVPECNLCTPIAAVFSSNVLAGGTNCVSMNLTNLDTNESIFQLLEFTGNIMTHEWNNCLVDGCYSLTFDSCLPLAAGEGLDYNVFVNGLSILENALITYSDDYAMTIQFGINSTCLNTTCNANFTIIAGDNPGEVLINNLSELSGQVNYSWTFGDGNGNLGNNSVYTFSQNGTYEICLTASNNLCEDTYCSSISVINSTCNNTGVLVQLSSDYQLPNMSDLLTVLISIEDNAIGQYDLEVVPFNTYPLSFCIPNGCYTIELISNNPLTALGIFAEVISNNQLISESSLLYGSTYSATEFGINTNCEDAVMETPLSELDIYPNPSTSQVFIKLSKEYVVNDIFLFDNFGRKVMYINPNDRSVMVEHLSSGIYYLQIITQKGVMTRAIEVIH